MSNRFAPPLAPQPCPFPTSGVSRDPGNRSAATQDSRWGNAVSRNRIVGTNEIFRPIFCPRNLRNDNIYMPEESNVSQLSKNIVFAEGIENMRATEKRQEKVSSESSVNWRKGRSFLWRQRWPIALSQEETTKI